MEQSTTQYELDIRVLAQTIIQKWHWPLISALIACSIGTFYCFIVSPIYRAEVVLIPPSHEDIRSLEVARLGTGKLNQDDIFQQYKRNIASRHEQEKFLLKAFTAQLAPDRKPEFQTSSADGFNRKTRDFISMQTDWLIPLNVKPSDTKQDSADFRNLHISINADHKGTRTHIIASLEWFNSEEAVRLLRDLVHFSDLRTVNNLTIETLSGIQTRIENIQDLITFKRKLYGQEKYDRITALKEAANNAHSIGAAEPIPFLSQNTIVEITPPSQLYKKPVDITLQPRHINDIETYLPLYHMGSVKHHPKSLISSDKPPLYARGWVALEAETNVLQLRTDDDPFIPDMRRLQHELSWLETLTVNKQETKSIAAEPVQISQQPVHPNFMVIIGTSSLFGLVLGIFLLLCYQVLKRGAHANSRS